ncbi:MAG: flagellar protein FlaG [Spirochaetaceae bacterium]
MSMDISRLHYPSQFDRIHAAQAGRQAQRQEREGGSVTQTRSAVDGMASELESVSAIFNRELKFTVNRDLGDVVVKVIDTTTDKVIKELPPEALQRLHVRIRETLGLLFDETI